MTTIGLIGAGHIGSALARQGIRHGYDVVLSNSRGPETLVDLVAELGDRARAATPTEAAEAGDLVVVTVPFHAYTAVPAAPLVGKVVIDTNNYYPQRDGHYAELDDESTTVSEMLQAHLAGALVVKAFNHIGAQDIIDLARPAGAADRRALAVAGDDAAARERVASFVDEIGFDPVVLEALAEGWRHQRDTLAYGRLYDVAGLRQALAGAARYRDAVA